MVDLADQERAALFRLLQIGDVDSNTAGAHDTALAVHRQGSGADAPAHLPVRAGDPYLGLKIRLVFVGGRDDCIDPSKVLRIDVLADAVKMQINVAWLHPEDAVLPRVPGALAGDRVPVPCAHLACFKREAAAPLALQEAGIGCRELTGALAHALFQFRIELLELARLAIKLGEYLHLRAQYLWHDRHRDIVHGAHLVAAQPVHVGQVDRGNEDDGGPLEPRMLTDHGRKLEAIQLRHAHVDQDDGNVVPQQMIERLARGCRHQKVLVQLLQDHFVGEELGGLIVHQEDIDLVVHGHGSPI